MKNNYEKLSKNAIKGDENAIKELFVLGEELLATDQYELATTVFRDAAIAYRIFAFWKKEYKKDAEKDAEWAKTVQGIYKRWIEQNPEGMRKLPYNIAGIDAEWIREVVVINLLHEEFFENIFYFLQNTLSNLGMDFSSYIGGSIQRRVCMLLQEAFGLRNTYESKYLLDADVRVGLDLLADEIIERCPSA